jgi:hypothetical protein
VPPPLVAGHSDQERPLGSYLVLIALFNGLLVAWLVLAGRGRRLPAGYRASDLLLLGAATSKLSRLLTRDRVTSGLRAPFTRFQGDAGHGEVDEAARGRGMRRAIGELLVCDFCLAQWVSAALVAGFTVSPRVTRAVAAVFTVYGVADALQLSWSRALERS